MYGQIISILFLLLVLYYVAMILLDIQKDRAMKAAELEKNNEEEIDISDEASSFKPVVITREDSPKKTPADLPDNKGNKSDKRENSNKQQNENKQNSDNEKQPENKEQSTSTDDAPKTKPETKPETATPTPENVETPGEKDFCRPGYREATMTDYVYVEILMEEVDTLAETGSSDLGNIIYCCQNARS